MDRLAEMPRAPSTLNRAGKRFWRETGQELIGLGLLTRADLATFEAMASHYGIMIDAQRQIRKDGITTVDERGLIRKHPLFSVMHQASQLYKAYAGLFGLDPLNRLRLNTDHSDKEPSLAEILNMTIET